MAYVSKYLTHWVGRGKEDEEKFEILTQRILRHQALLYSKCAIEFRSRYGGIEPGAWQVPMVCFTDIPFSEVEKHCENYSSFGISFDKPYMLTSCVAPVWYSVSPFVYEAYSYLYHRIKGMKDILEDHKVPQGEHQGEIYKTEEMLLKLHEFISLSQNYFMKEFDPGDPSLEPDDKTLKFLRETNEYYLEREWRSVFRSSGDFPWITSHDGNNYFKFSRDAIHAVIVPSAYIKRMMDFLRNEFQRDPPPLVYCYEDLKNF